MRLPWRIGIQQRVLPVYRTQLFDMIGEECEAGLQLFAGAQRNGEGIAESTSLKKAVLVRANNQYIHLGGSHLLIQNNILHWLREWQPECLIVEANPRNISTPSAIRWAKKRHVKVIGWGLGMPVGKALRAVKTSFWRSYLNQFDALITYSSSGKERYSKAGYPAERIFIALNAVARKPETINHLRPDHYLDHPSILTVGRLIEVKKIDKLLYACSQLPSDMKPRLTIVGDGPARQQWINLARQVYPDAEFPGDVRGEQLEEYFRKADLFVLPGTGGLAVQQAMSFGLPVIVGSADGTQTDLVRARNGWQLADGQIETLTQILELALADVKRLRLMGKESWRIVNEEVNLEAMVKAFTQAIANTMST